MNRRQLLRVTRQDNTPRRVQRTQSEYRMSDIHLGRFVDQQEIEQLILSGTAAHGEKIVHLLWSCSNQSDAHSSGQPPAKVHYLLRRHGPVQGKVNLARNARFSLSVLRTQAMQLERALR